VSEYLNMSCKSGPACVYESDTSAERVDETAKDRQEDWYGQWQWRCGYERGWDKAMEKREWVGLDHEQLRNTTLQFNQGALWAERYLKEKNT
jgi:hypothetical protein